MANPNGGLMITPRLIKLTGVQEGANKVFNKPCKHYVAVAKDMLDCFDNYTKHRVLADTVNNAIRPWKHNYEVKLDAIYDHDWELVFVFTLRERVY